MKRNQEIMKNNSLKKAHEQGINGKFSVLLESNTANINCSISENLQNNTLNCKLVIKQVILKA